MAMHDRNDQDVVRLDRIENRIRKNPRESATNIACQNEPSRGRLQDAIERGFDTANETRTQADLYRLVVFDRALVLGKGET